MNIDKDVEGTNQNYRDAYFESGHILLKIWQTIVLIIGWIFFFTPCVITILTYLAYLTRGRYGHYFWYYSEGFDMINLVIILLIFALAMIAVFCISFSYVQYQRAKGLVTKWPMYDISENKNKRQNAENFMTERFGEPQLRQNVRYYEVEPEQNLGKSQLKDVINKEDDKK
ncbi:ABC transporter permease [Lactobacillus acidophilus]|uniref:ABC transporter permease n=1 Tax=Lactobacillus acidophilus TaxID=1579 RepID=UPI0021A53BE1|nr:ABC transporter permease [Lactobacillus acidophilus]MCT3602288.1 ABC transporter permease [Lactobacillus acidophilus]MCT3624555.1 ABC transporter permease [Lactobacillus acidophilus]